MSIHVPWRIQRATYLAYQQTLVSTSNIIHNVAQRPRISFYQNYHTATTGATVAIAAIANNLAEKYSVDAYVTRHSGLSRQLNLRIRQTFSPQKLAGDIVFVDIEQENKVISELVREGRKVILTCHALPTILHSVPQAELKENLRIVDEIHFVSEYQKDEFILHYPDITIAEKSFVIANYTRESKKSNTTGNVGIVGFLTRPEKNALPGILLGEKSNANTIECWGSDSIAGIPNPSIYPKLRLNGWSDKLPQIHNSFDVLISTSKYETFGLVVAEALSAGVSCVISDIPPFRRLYSDCEGVAILSGDESVDISTINQMLQKSATLKASNIAFWRSHFSSSCVKEMWLGSPSLVSTKNRKVV